MKNLGLIILIACMNVCVISAQDITGQWNGLLNVQGTQLRVVLHMNKTDTGYSSTLDSPDQGAKDIPVSLVSFVDSILKIEASGGIRYEGTLNRDNQLVGEFRQSTFSAPLTFSRDVPVKEKIVRPQEPVEPYPYYTEEVQFANPTEDVVLAGTLSLPKKEGLFPAVVLITGSGAQDRNEELMGHKPFLVLADHLTKNGIAVLRYDDRGTAKSTGDFTKATMPNLVTDVEAAVSYLLTRKEIDKKKIGLIGHSEGGAIAPVVAANHKNIRFIVLMAGPGIRGKELLLLQQELVGRASGLTEEKLAKGYSNYEGAFDLLLNAVDQDSLQKDLKVFLDKMISEMPAEEKPPGMSNDDFAKMIQGLLLSPWFQYFLKYDPSPILTKVHCPVLALSGSKDLQVSPRENLSAIKSALDKGGNKNATVREFPNLNHFFQECTTGSPAEYGGIQQTISPQVLNEISSWILRQTK